MIKLYHHCSSCDVEDALSSLFYECSLRTNLRNKWCNLLGSSHVIHTFFPSSLLWLIKIRKFIIISNLGLHINFYVCNASKNCSWELLSKMAVMLISFIANDPLRKEGGKWITFFTRSNHQRCSLKKGVLKTLAKFTGKYMYQSLFFNKFEGLRPAALLKKRLWNNCVPVNFAILQFSCEILCL